MKGLIGIYSIHVNFVWFVWKFNLETRFCSHNIYRCSFRPTSDVADLWYFYRMILSMQRVDFQFRLNKIMFSYVTYIAVAITISLHFIYPVVQNTNAM